MKADEAALYHFFHMFKMRLYKCTDEEMTLSDQDGNALTAVLVIAACLRYISAHALKVLGGQARFDICMADVLWVVTVPAIWNDCAKGIMRRAAFDAGMMAYLRSPQLVLCLEPEAASIRARETTEDAAFRFRKGIQFITADAGHGTLDTTVHRVVGDTGAVEELKHASGDDMGGSCVDDNFRRLMNRLCGPLYAEWRRLYPKAEYELLRDWIDTKAAMQALPDSAGPDAPSFNCKLPATLLLLMAQRGNVNRRCSEAL